MHGLRQQPSADEELICLLAVNGIFQGNHMGTLVFFLAGTVLSLVLTMMIKEASLKERRIE